MKNCILAAYTAILIYVLLTDQICCGRVHYQYKKYTYRKKRDDKTYKSLKQPCEVNPDCLAKRGAAQAICIRKCVSEFCYLDIYGDDEGSSGPANPIRVNEISGLWKYLMSIDWTEPWFMGLGVFHLLCIILTFTLRKTGAIQTVYFGILMLTVFCAEYINKWAAMHWSLFARQQYFDSNGLFISVVFSMPLLINCMVIVLSWLWDVGHLISDAKRLKILKINRAKKSAERDTVTDENMTDEKVTSEEKKEK